ncbi:REST corepressor 3 isoform X3 [Macrosteles quadrilineatus]|uniref:REST corepressor 3 isoform X3 n=1 Tax=Macrosteles quadrilineatus TaxID=74068 RepID=UPI0023E108CC|nr:REST corepressor 3 isoform X3 [Macrosteles quadrilineatus]
MVLSERNSDNIRNGRRSRGPSPNGHASESSSEDEAEKIRVGRDYQAVVPDFIPVAERRLDQCPDRALLVWSPTVDISDTKLDEYISLAKEKYGYNGEQALGMLFWHKHDLEKAICDLANFTPFPDEWTVEDKVLFEQAYQFHGKSFHRIRQMLPDKTIATLVKYYYSWKKTRSRTSLMDRQARKLSGRGAGAGEEGAGSDAASDLGSNSDSENEDKERGEGSSCSNCNVTCSHVHATPKGNMCNTCFTHWKRTGNLRPTVGPTKPRDRQLLLRNKRKPPRGMYVNHDDLVAMASGPAGQGEQMLRATDREIVALKRQEIISLVSDSESDQEMSEELVLGSSFNWVYHLKRPKLIEQLEKFGLPTNVNVEKGRKILIAFLKGPKQQTITVRPKESYRRRYRPVSTSGQQQSHQRSVDQRRTVVGCPRYEEVRQGLPSYCGGDRNQDRGPHEVIFCQLPSALQSRRSSNGIRSGTWPYPGQR